ncbi:SPV011 putative interleukin-18 binding protein [Swinepox virus]|uniref:Uncharacterized protein C9 n=2 Tax=Swinepox virus TaxID=10276 RepID=VC09_SWPVK|nr:IL-18 binding protein [Swinepox virus]P32223.1 RecName: Full=Uncharacterized protein C9 [Swinepox virus (STRAIN KASZA)]AAC37862.1 ORF C9L [Swinepox virus]AAL69750.1 SPV011 putative interleukin-18 binding protein [Swinepox virus]UED36657.1 IL-18 binding protein [Swinepox virus]UED36806.1 IL-18 binding protein [Swinepox virus]UUA44201.1 SPV011 [Swinepox virus]
MNRNMWIVLSCVLYMIYICNGRDVLLYPPHKKTNKVIVKCNGYTNSTYSILYWMVGNNNTFVEQLNSDHYKEKKYNSTEKNEHMYKLRTDLIIYNITSEMEMTKLTCVLSDIYTPIKASIILNNLWSCLNTTQV